MARLQLLAFATVGGGYGFEEDHELEDGELTTVEEVNKAIHDIRERVQDAAKHTDVENIKSELGQKYDKLSADMVEASQKLAQIAQTAEYGSKQTGGGTNAYKAYQKRDPETGEINAIRMYGEVDPVTKAYEPGLLDAEKPIDDWHEKLLELQQQYAVVTTFRSNPGRPQSRKELMGLAPQTLQRMRTHLQAAPAPIAKIFGDASNIGDVLIPNQTQPMLERDLRLARRVEALYQVVDMPDKVFNLPYRSGGGRPYKKGEHVSDDPAQHRSSSLTLTEQTVTAFGLAVRYQVDEDAAEDAIIAVEPLFRMEQVADLIDGTEDMIINSDTNSTHQDTGLAGWDIRGRWGSSGLGTSADHRRLCLGLRAKAIDRSANINGDAEENYAGLVTARGTLDSPHGLAGDVVILSSPEYVLKMMAFSEVLTVDKYGPSAVILTGELARIGGMPIIPTEFIDSQYNTNGIYDNSTKTRTGLIMHNRARFKIGRRRGIMTEAAKDITRGKYDYVTTRRMAFFDLDAAAATKNVVWVYDLTP